MRWRELDPFDMDPMAQVGDADARQDQATLDHLAAAGFDTRPEQIMRAFRELMTEAQRRYDPGA